MLLKCQTIDGFVIKFIWISSLEVSSKQTNKYENKNETNQNIGNVLKQYNFFLFVIVSVFIFMCTQGFSYCYPKQYVLYIKKYFSGVEFWRNIKLPSLHHFSFGYYEFEW